MDYLSESGRLGQLHPEGTAVTCGKTNGRGGFLEMILRLDAGWIYCHGEIQALTASGVAVGAGTPMAW
jgi:hypothetical protein